MRGPNKFDKDWHDYDIVTEAVLAVLAAKPSSPVGLLTDGTVALTALVVLEDNDPDDPNPIVIQFNLNKGNRQIAHGISRVLRPINL